MTEDNMFKNNKYTRWYDAIISHAKQRDHKDIGYTEKHHAIPKSLGGDKDDLVFLTPREHLVCHMLLIRMLDGKEKQKMSWALHRMLFSENHHQTRHKPSARTYENFRKQFYGQMKGVPANRTPEHQANINAANTLRLKGKTLPEEWCAKMSQSRTGEGNGMYNKKHRPESIEKMRANRKGKGGAKISAAQTGRKMTDQAKANLSASLNANPRERTEEERLKLSISMKAMWAAKKASR